MKKVHTFVDFLEVIYNLTLIEYDNLDWYQKKAIDAHWKDWR